jgi:hypothetical protein
MTGVWVYGRVVSVDLEATLDRPVALGAVLSEARKVLSDVLNTAVPGLVVFVDREYWQGERVGLGRRLDTAELRDLVIGGPIPAGSVHFEIEVPDTGDGVALMVFDEQAHQVGLGRCAVFSPYRTCVGVVVAAGLALATARLAAGRYVDEDIGMLAEPEHDPDRVIDRTRLSGSGDFVVQCERYLRQFPRLNGWPQDRSVCGSLGR